jgi:hypothetical protein
MNEALTRKRAIDSQSACNVSGLLYSVGNRAAEVTDLAADPVLRLYFEQVSFLTGLARLDAVILMEMQDRNLDLAGLLDALAARRDVLIASPEWRTVGSPLFEQDLTVRALTVLALEAFTVTYEQAYSACADYAAEVVAV